ncbi:MAG: hypothetical protein WCW31_01185 [Patescibacteria group bacterium]|jgi:hypothetical protein
MKKTLFFAILGVFAVLGAGCKASEQPVQTGAMPLPKLDILSPGLATSTWQSSIHIVGTTDAKIVWVAKLPHEPYQGKFDIEVNLDKDEASIPVSVGNGIATTTIDVKVTKVAVPSTPGVKTTTQTKTTTRTPTTAAKNPSANPKSTPAPLPVKFSGTEMQLDVSLDAYGANLGWTMASSEFKTYVIVKSTTDPNLYFPKQFWIKAFNDISTRAWRDTAVAAGKTTYYRVCNIALDQSVTCGNVAHVTK